MSKAQDTSFAVSNARSNSVELILLERFIKLDFAFYKAADASVMNTQGQGGVFGRVARLRPPVVCLAIAIWLAFAAF